MVVFSQPPTSQYINNKFLIDVLENFVITTAVPFVTFVVVALATAITNVTLRRAMAWRDGAGQGNSKKSQVLLLLLGERGGRTGQ